MRNRRLLILLAVMTLVCSNIVACGRTSKVVEIEKSNTKETSKDNDEESSDGESLVEENSVEDGASDTVAEGENDIQPAVDPEQYIYDALDDYQYLAGSNYGKYLLIGDDYFGEYSYDAKIEGVIDYAVDDFDKDGVQEILQVTVGADEAVVLKMLEFSQESSAYCESASVVVGSINLMDKGQLDIFEYEFNNKNCIVCYLHELACQLADGTGLEFQLIWYDGKDFCVEKQYDYAGSDGFEDEEFTKALSEIGIEANWKYLIDGRTMLIDHVPTGKMIVKLYQRMEEYVGSESIGVKKRFGTLYLGGYSNDGYAAFSESMGLQIEYGAVLEEFVIPDSGSRYLTEMDLENLSKEECRIARNEIMARYGRLFKDAKLQAYFDSKSWYFGYIMPDDFNENIMTQLERDNVYFIQAYENEHFK